MKRLLYLTILLSFVATPNAFVNNKDWNGQSEYAEGYSKWSTTNNCPNEDTCVRQYIYLPVKEWSSSTSVSESQWKDITTTTAEDGSVQKKNGSKVYYRDYVPKTLSSCDDGYKPSNTSGHGNAKTHTMSTAWYCKDCSIIGRGNQYFCSTVLDQPICFNDTTVACKEPGSTGQTCMEANCRVRVETGGYCTDNPVSVAEGCGVHSTKYYVQTSSLFKSSSDTKNWKKSLSDAGGYAKKVAVYSYPLNFKVNFHGEGSNGTCTFERDLTECSIF